MLRTIKTELKQHVIALIDDGVLTDDNKEDWHFHAFNEDYYIIGYYLAEQWLKKHDLSAWTAISTCVEYEKDNFGEVSKDYDNAETTVNMLVYIYGEEIIYNSNAETIVELKEALG